MSSKDKWFLEIVQDRIYQYHANMLMNGERVNNLPESVPYAALKTAIKLQTGITIPLKQGMLFYSQFGKRYAWIDTTQTRPDCRVTLAEMNAGHKPDFTNGYGNYYGQ